MRRFAAKVKRRLAAQARYRRFHSLAGGGRADREIAVVLGNCQADPLARILRSGPLAANYEFVRIPPVHLIDGPGVEALRRVLPRTSLFIGQRVRDGYRGLPIGTEESERLLPASATRVHFPVMYYEGLYPYQVYVRHSGDTSEMAPRTAYADLRTIAAAARGLSGDEGVAYARSLVADADSIRANAERSIKMLREREAELDVQASEGIAGLSFHTVNHPSNSLLRHVADGVAVAMGIAHTHAVPVEPFLDDVHSPFGADVAAALGIEAPARAEWLIHGKAVHEDVVFRAHLEWFSQRPELVAAAVRQHGRKLEAFGFEL